MNFLYVILKGQNDQTGTKDKTVSDRRTSMVSFHLRRNVVNVCSSLCMICLL